MLQSKIELTNRLTREGRWAAASLWRDGKRRELRDGGMIRAEAREEAWRLMELEYPPLPSPEPVPLSTTATTVVADRVVKVQPDEMNVLAEIFGKELKSWIDEYDVRLPKYALTELRCRSVKRIIWAVQNPGKWRKGSIADRVYSDGVEPL